MKLLFDENISFRIVKKCLDIFPQSIHVSNVRPLLVSDASIFEYAKRMDFIIVTFDQDFSDIQSLKGYPPKIIWLRIGNTSTLNVLHRLSDNKQAIIDLNGNAELGILVIY